MRYYIFIACNIKKERWENRAKNKGWITINEKKDEYINLLTLNVYSLLLFMKNFRFKFAEGWFFNKIKFTFSKKNEQRKTKNENVCFFLLKKKERK